MRFPILIYSGSTQDRFATKIVIKISGPRGNGPNEQTTGQARLINKIRYGNLRKAGNSGEQLHEQY